MKPRRAFAEKRPPQAEAGFTLIELLVAMAIFLTISAALFSLLLQQQQSTQTLQGQVGLNLSLRNAAAQLQMDLTNAGSNFSNPAASIVASWPPLAVTLVNNVVPSSSTPCYTVATSTYLYGPSCFDQLNVINAADPGTYPPINATDINGGGNPSSNCSDTSTATAYGRPASGGVSLAQTAAEFKSGDQLLFYKSTGSQITSVVLLKDAEVGTSAVKFTFKPTGGLSNPSLSDGSNNLSNDPLNISACSGTQPCTLGQINATGSSNTTARLASQYCANDWIVKLAPVSYWVDTSTAANPVLMRRQNGVAAEVTEQVIGLKVGAATSNGSSSGGTTTSSYIYDASQYTNQTNQAYNFGLIRTVRISLIGRTTPNTNPTYVFRNSFDHGPYQVQGISVVVNPRNVNPVDQFIVSGN